MSALTGTRVVELASERVAWAGKLLGDMGADVVLVEGPEGEASRAYPPFADDQEGGGRHVGEVTVGQIRPPAPGDDGSHRRPGRGLRRLDLRVRHGDGHRRCRRHADAE